MFKTKEEFKYEFSKRIIETYGRTVEESHITEKFLVLELMVRDYASVNWATSKALIRNNNQKQMHYFSMEFLMGRLLVNNMMNLGIYDIAKEGLAEFGINIHDLEELESDAGLGNGGLGRLAACFMDSLLHLLIQGMDIQFVMNLDCLNKKLKMVIKLNYLINGCKLVLIGK